MDIKIYRDTHHFTYGIYRKPTTTNSIIPSSYCHSQEHKYSAVRYVHNRLSTYPISTQHRLQEKQAKARILHQNNYPPILPTSQEYKSQQRLTDITQQTQHNWAKFTYSGKETRFVTKILKKACLSIAFTTRQTIVKLLAYKTDRLSDKYEGSGVYQPACLDCQKCYVGQTAVRSEIASRNIRRITRTGNHGSNFAKHLLDCQHTGRPVEDSMSILYVSNKGRMLNTLERFHIYKEIKNQNQINDRHTISPNAIFDVLLSPTDSNLNRPVPRL
jgi:hypothetical protein